MGRAMPSLKTPQPARSFVPGPALADGAALLGWLRAHPDARVRIPVVILFSPDGLRAPRLTFLGTDPAPPAEDAILLELDDSALGIGLDTRLRSLCDAESDACAVWIEGTWGPLLPGLRSTEAPPWPVTVRDVGPLVKGSPKTILVAR